MVGANFHQRVMRRRLPPLWSQRGWFRASWSVPIRGLANCLSNSSAGCPDSLAAFRSPTMRRRAARYSTSVRASRTACGAVPLLSRMRTPASAVAFNIATCTVGAGVRQGCSSSFGAAGLHIAGGSACSCQRCGRPPRQATLSPLAEMTRVDRIKAAGRMRAGTIPGISLWRVTDAHRARDLERRSSARGDPASRPAPMIFPEAVTRAGAVSAFQASGEVFHPREYHRVRPHAAVHARRSSPRSGRRVSCWYCCAAYRAMNAAALATYQAIRRDGTQRALLERMQTRTSCIATAVTKRAFEQRLDRLFQAAKNEGES